MFCPKCGNKIQDGVRFCGKCGSEVETVGGENREVSSVQGQTPEKSGAKSDSKSVVLIGKMVIIIALVCFFFTFMSVSCAGETQKISGKDMIFGDSSITDSLDEEYDSHSNLFNIFVCLSGVSGIIAIIITKRKASAGFASLSAIFLLIFRFSAKHYYQIGDRSLKDWEEMNLETHFGFALYLAIVLFFLGAAIIEGAALDANEGKTPSTPSLNASNAPPASSECTVNAGMQSEEPEKQQ